MNRQPGREGAQPRPHASRPPAPPLTSEPGLESPRSRYVRPPRGPGRSRRAALLCVAIFCVLLGLQGTALDEACWIRPFLAPNREIRGFVMQDRLETWMLLRVLSLLRVQKGSPLPLSGTQFSSKILVARETGLALPCP